MVEEGEVDVCIIRPTTPTEYSTTNSDTTIPALNSNRIELRYDKRVIGGTVGGADV